MFFGVQIGFKVQWAFHILQAIEHEGLEGLGLRIFMHAYMPQRAQYPGMCLKLISHAFFAVGVLTKLTFLVPAGSGGPARTGHTV